MNKEKRLYERADAAIMKGVNAGVRAWNWTTGETKADLANKMLIIAPALVVTNQIDRNEIGGSVVVGTVLALNNLYFARKNSRIERKESEALKNHAKDLEVEKYKNLAKLTGPAWIIPFVTWMHLPDKKGFFTEKASQTDCLPLIGIAMEGASFYVMRAENLPPRRNVLYRAAEKSMEWIRSFQTQPVPSVVVARGNDVIRGLRRT